MFRWICRMFLTLFLLCLACVGLLAYAYWVEPNMLVVRSVDVESDQVTQPCKIVFFTDTHFGQYYDISHARKITDQINALEPDIVVFGGDLFDNYARDRETLDLSSLSAAFAEIEAKAGKFAVWGNHDYGGGAARVYEDVMEASGFEVLDDESRLLSDYGLRVVGYDDLLMGWTDPALYTLKSQAFNVIVAHEPVIAQKIESSSQNLVLTGHTHGGQVTIPVLTDRLLPPGLGEFRKGFYDAQEIGTDADLQMYTSSGIGMTRYPFRFLNAPEIVEINVHAA